MKNRYFYTSEGCLEKLLDYPCLDSNTRIFQGKKASVFDTNEMVRTEWLSSLGAEVTVNPTNKETSFSNIGIISQIAIKENSEEGYFKVLDYYIPLLQLLIHKMKGLSGFNHIVVILPQGSDKCGTSLCQMAAYSVYGLIKGLGELYAPYGLFINAIVLNEDSDESNFRDMLVLLCSDNSNNIVGQVFSI